MYNFKLLCTFSYKKNLNSVIDDVIYQFNGLQKIFVFTNKDNEKECYLTFNIDLNLNDRFEKYIIIHRKKETNTLYTINALNLLIKELNGGVVDPNYKIEWNDFKNTILLTQGSDLRKLQTKINKIVSA